MRMKRVLAAIAATLLLAVAVDSATAGRIAPSELGFRLTWGPARLTGITPASCNLTLEGSFTSGTIQKAAGLTIGQISSASVGSCSQGSFTALAATLPWTVAYKSFTGTLPNIERMYVTLLGVSLNLNGCLSTSTSGSPVNGYFTRQAGGTVSSFTVVETLLGCWGWEGTGTAARLGTTVAFSLTLI